VGDTVTWKPFNNVVASIDSVETPDGEFLRRINFDQDPDYWLEGFGSGIALFGSYMPPPFECGCDMKCAEANDVSYPYSFSCGFPVGMPTIPSESKLQIFPNPFSNFVSVTSTLEVPAILITMNSQGKKISSRKLKPFEKITFTDAELPVGEMIFFQLISEGVALSGRAIRIL
jgi:hypothetical protein